MLELIILYFITGEIANLARRKGLRPGLWKFYNVAGWIAFEIIGIMFGLMIFGSGNIISVFLVAILFAVTSYFLIKGYLNSLPDIDIDIDNLGAPE